MVLDPANVILAVQTLVGSRILDGLVDDEVLDGLQLLVHAVQFLVIEVSLLFLRLGTFIVVLVIVVGAAVIFAAFLELPVINLN